ncbi:MAG TPA: hypothetical protein VIG08_12730 [Gemmatimonadales bacterium]|jgi:hypothetical protein
MMTSRPCWVALAIVLLQACGAGSQSAGKQSPTPELIADQILAGERRALGDVARVRTLSSTATVTGPSGASFQASVFSATDGRTRLALGQGFLGGIGAIVGWTYDPSVDSVRPLDKATKSMIRGHELHMLVLAPLSRLRAPQGGARRIWQGEEVLEVVFRDDLDAPATMYLRARDTLPLGMRVVNHTGKGLRDIDVTFARWQEVDGVRLFRHAVFAQGPDRYIYNYTDIRLNAVADSMFEAPKRRH